MKIKAVRPEEAERAPVLHGNGFEASVDELERVGHQPVAAWIDLTDGSVWVMMEVAGYRFWTLYAAPT